MTRPLARLFQTTIGVTRLWLVNHLNGLGRWFGTSNSPAGQTGLAPAQPLSKERAELDQLRQALLTDRRDLERAMVESEQRFTKLEQLSTELNKGREEFRNTTLALQAEQNAVDQTREAVEGERRDLHQMKQDLEQERAQLTETGRSREEKLSTLSELAELRRVVDAHRLELDESIRLLRTDITQFDDGLLGRERESRQLGTVIRGELEGLSAQFAEYQHELAQSKSRWQDTQSELAEFRQAIDRQQLELEECLRLWHVCQSDSQQTSDKLSAQGDKLDVLWDARGEDHAELKEVCTWLEKNRSNLAQATGRSEHTNGGLAELRRALDESEARVQRVQQALEEDRAELAQIRKSLQDKQTKSAPDQAWIRREIERAVTEAVRPKRKHNSQDTQDSIRFHCSNCSTKLVVRANYAGKRGVCKACDTTIVIPGGKA